MRLVTGGALPGCRGGVRRRSRDLRGDVGVTLGAEPGAARREQLVRGPAMGAVALEALPRRGRRVRVLRLRRHHLQPVARRADLRRLATQEVVLVRLVRIVAGRALAGAERRVHLEPGELLGQVRVAGAAERAQVRLEELLLGGRVGRMAAQAVLPGERRVRSLRGGRARDLVLVTVEAHRAVVALQEVFAVGPVRLVAARALAVGKRPMDHRLLQRVRDLVVALAAQLLRLRLEQALHGPAMRVVAAEALAARRRRMGRGLLRRRLDVGVAGKAELRHLGVQLGARLAALHRVARLAVALGRRRMRGLAPQRGLLRRVRVVAVEAGEPGDRELRVSGRRVGGLVTGRAERVTRDAEQAGVLRAVSVVADVAVALGEDRVLVRLHRLLGRGLVALEAGVPGSALAQEMRLVGRVRIVAGEALALDEGEVGVLGFRGRLQTVVAAVAQLRHGLREDELLQEAMAPVAGRAFHLGHRRVDDLLRFVVLLRLLVAVVAGTAPGHVARLRRAGQAGKQGRRGREEDGRDERAGEPGRADHRPADVSRGVAGGAA